MKKRRRSNRRGTAVGLKEIAKSAGVSTATVSRVIHGNPHVKEELRQRVTDCIDRMAYRPNIAARSLRMRRTALVGVVLPTFSNPHFSDALRAMQTVADARGYTLLIASSDGDSEKTDNALHSLLTRQVDGIILVPTARSTSQMLDEVLKSGTPVVAMDRRVQSEPRIDHITVNVRKGTSDAVRLLAKQGRKRIAFIAGPSNIWTASEKLSGYGDGIRAAGMKLDKDLILPGDYLLEGGATQATELLKRKNRPDAVIVANNLMTLGAIRVLLRENIKMPRDIALIGFDDTDWTDVVRPTISVIAQPVSSLGGAAMEQLLSRIDNKKKRRKAVDKVLPVELILRESTNT